MDTLKKLFSLEGKVILITGGAQGIGKAVAEHIAGVGADIVIFDRQAEKAQATADASRSNIIAKRWHLKSMLRSPIRSRRRSKRRMRPWESWICCLIMRGLFCKNR